MTAKWLWLYQCPLIALTWSLVTPGPCLSCANAQPWCWSWPFTSKLSLGLFLVSSGCCGGLDSWPPSPGWCSCCWSPLTVLAALFGNLNPNPHHPRAPLEGAERSAVVLRPQAGRDEGTDHLSGHLLFRRQHQVPAMPQGRGLSLWQGNAHGCSTY